MPIESAIFVSGVTLLFIVFGVTLFWAQRQTKDLDGSSPVEPAE